MTNAERRSVFFEAEVNGRRLYDDERLELEKLLRSRAVTPAERDRLAVALLNDQERSRLKRLAWSGSTITVVTIAGLLIAASVVVAFRWHRHTQHIVQLQSRYDQLSRLFDRFSNAYDPTVDAFNSYDHRRKAFLASWQNASDIGTIAIVKDKADNLRSTELAFTQSIHKMKDDLPQGEQRKEAGTFSDVDVAASNSNDQLLAFSATIQAGLNNPFAFAAMNGTPGRALGERIGRTMYRFKDTADTVLDDVYRDTMALNSQKNAANAALARERKQPLERWLLAP